MGSNVTRLFRIATASIDFHLRHGGRGAAFGKYSEIEGLEVDWGSKFYKDVEVDGTATIAGIDHTISSSDMRTMATDMETTSGLSNILKALTSKVKATVYNLGLIQDYVTEHGKSGVWTYAKYKSGKCEVMGTYSASFPASTAIVTSSHRSIVSVNMSNFFTEVIGGVCGDAPAHGTITVHRNGTNKYVMELWKQTASAESASTISCPVWIVGKWK